MWSDVVLLMFNAEAAAAEDAFTTRGPKRTPVVFVNLRMAKGRTGKTTSSRERLHTAKASHQNPTMLFWRRGEHT